MDRRDAAFKSGTRVAPFRGKEGAGEENSLLDFS
jgi:hypothetical protein